jgi:hypothetical protein
MHEQPDQALTPSEQSEIATTDREVPSYPYFPLCYRLSNLSLELSQSRLLDALREANLLPPSQKADGYLLDLHPASSGRTQTALLRLERSNPNFAAIPEDKDQCVKVFSTDEPLIIDRHFRGLTTLNDPGEDVIAELVLFLNLPLLFIVDFLQRHSSNRPRGSCVWLLEKP